MWKKLLQFFVEAVYPYGRAKGWWRKRGRVVLDTDTKAKLRKLKKRADRHR